jgi:hypothetical protein|tara:strand:- start:600 stop:1229 length:630 start_codon:yes stop_codon:yes gene_type:complete
MKFDLLYEQIVKDYPKENPTTKAIFVFGRMNPPTAGHELLINHMQSIADKEKRQPFVFISRTQNAKSDPLAFSDKIALLNLVVPNSLIVDDPMAITPFHAGYWLRDHGFKDVKIIAGSDRVPEYEERMRPYIDHEDPKKSFNFTRFKVESFGDQRDPDSDDASGISASKARQLADSGNLAGFAQILPASTPQEMAEDLYNKIRKAHGVT